MALIVVLALVMFVVIFNNAVSGYRGGTERLAATHICADCGTLCAKVTSHRAGWTFLFFPLNLPLAKKKIEPCSLCQGRLIPVDSPRGKRQTS
jgi:hypothetical protein